MTGKTRILIVDDDPSVLRLLDTALTHYGYLPSTCPDGTTALKQAVPGSFELLMIDYRLGTPNGLEVVKTLRQRGLAVPVILMSSHFPDDVAAGLKDDPATVLFLKPFDLRALKAEIDRLIP